MSGQAIAQDAAAPAPASGEVSRYLEAADAHAPNTNSSIVIRKMQLREKITLIGSIALTLTALVAFGVIFFFAHHDNISGQHVIQSIGIVFLVYGTVMLAVVADTDQQLTAAVGILGAIAGYMFGARVAGKDGPPASDPGRNV